MTPEPLASRLAAELEADGYSPKAHYAAAAELRRLAGVEAERDDYLAETRTLVRQNGEWQEKCDRLAAEVESLRADAERYRAVRDDDCHPYGICIWDEDDGWAQDARKPDVIDAAIDTARKEQG